MSEVKETPLQEAVKAAVLPTKPVQTVVKPVVQAAKPVVPVKTSLQAAVAGTAGVPKRPAGLKSGNTGKLTDQSFFRAVVYSETSARKTTLAAEFAGPEFTRIILTRSEDQLIPLSGGPIPYQYEFAPDAESLSFALKHPEALWPDWAAMPDPEKKRTIVLDDLTAGVAALIESNTGAADRRQSYTGALSDLNGLVHTVSKKPYNLILISLARVAENKMSGEERIGPDLSPSLMNFVTAEFAAVLYIKTKNYKLLTDRDVFTVEGTDDKGKTINYSREIFAKVKMPKLVASTPGHPLRIAKEEPMDLAALWAKVKKAQGGK